MLDSTARVWERAGEVIISPPEPCRPFIDQIKARCCSARYSSLGWAVSLADAAIAIDLLHTYFPVVQDTRQGTPPAPIFADGFASDLFTRLDLIPILAPIAPAFRAISNDRHAARTHLIQLSDKGPEAPMILGFAEGLDGHWMAAYAAQRFWQELLSSIGQMISGVVQADGRLREQIDPETLRQYWLTTRERICGTPPERTGQRWFPPQATLPIWVAALLACIEGPPFALESDRSMLRLYRMLSPWPLRIRDDLHRLDLKDAAHWPISVCVLPGRQSRDGNDALLHLSSVNGISKNRALWAAVLDGRREQIPVRTGYQRHYPRRVDGRNQYVADWNDEPLPTSGLSHLALTHRSAFEPELGQSFLHLAGNDASGTPDLPLFAQQLSRALSVPFNLTWAAQLWAYGTNPDDSETTLITPLPSTGCQGYWVLADEPRWTRLIVAIQRGVAPGSLSDAHLTIIEVGATSAIADVIEQAGEGGEESDEEDA
jgi:hypothetical protein